MLWRYARGIVLPAVAAVGFALSAVPSSADAAPREYYHTVSNYACLIDDRPSPYRVADRIARSGYLPRYYDRILESNAFRDETDAMDPIYVAYALFVIAERLGDRDARYQKRELEEQIEPWLQRKITATIYQKYSQKYLRKCFARNDDQQAFNALEIYPLYMDVGG